MEPYYISAESYLDRAKRRLAQPSPENLVYAALEIRCGVEARMQEYLEPQDHLPKKGRTSYRLNVLGRELDKVSPDDDRVTRLTVFSESGMYLGAYHYTPVSRRLRELAGKCGDLLHAPASAPSPETWQEAEALLTEAFQELCRACCGELLGTPLLGPDGTMRMNLVVPDGFPAPEEMRGQRFNVRIDYLESFPEELLKNRSTC